MGTRIASPGAVKTYRGLYPRIYAFENLYLAYRAARRGKRGRPEVAAFERCQEDELFALGAALQAKTYSPGAYRSFYIHEPKRRLISAAPFRDRVVHHALCRVIEPSACRLNKPQANTEDPGREIVRYRI